MYILNIVTRILAMLSKAFPNSVAVECALPEICTLRLHHKYRITSVRRDVIHEFESVVDKKAKLSLCLINYTPCHEDVLGSEGVAPPFLTSALD
jgi:hypothetical protein